MCIWIHGSFSPAGKKYGRTRVAVFGFSKVEKKIRENAKNRDFFGWKLNFSGSAVFRETKVHWFDEISSIYHNCSIGDEKMTVLATLALFQNNLGFLIHLSFTISLLLDQHFKRSFHSPKAFSWWMKNHWLRLKLRFVFVHNVHHFLTYML